MESVLEYLPESIKKEIYRFIMLSNADIEKKFIKKTNEKQEIEEVRLRIGKNIAIKTSNKNIILNHVVTVQELLETFKKICEQSIYTYQSQICKGFITIRGGHRVGITGNCVIENGKIININYVSSLNFRIAREKKDCSDSLLKYIIANDDVANTLIVSKPGGGKTTLLRDCIRKISTGPSAKTCGIVDERGEIASMYKGIAQNDIGVLSDVIVNSSKAQGMKMLIRSMSPEVIACDEIGSKEDIEAINYAMCSGVKGIFTAHGNRFEEILLNDQIKDLIEKNIIEVIVFLDDKVRGKIRNVYKLNKENKSYFPVLK